MDIDKEKLARDVRDSIQEMDINAKKIQVSIGRDKEPLPPSIILMQTFATLSASTLKANTCKVLFYLLGMSEFNNYVCVDVKTIQEDVGISRVTVVRALNELTENNIVTKHTSPMDRRRHDYFLHPVAAWKGSAVNRKTTIHRFIEDHYNHGQLSLFGEYLEDSLERERLEIKHKTASHTTFSRDRLNS